MASEGEGFKIAAGFVEVNLKDNTQADLAAIKARIESSGPADMRVGVTDASLVEARAKIEAVKKQIGDASPAKIPVTVDKPDETKTKDSGKQTGGWMATGIAAGVIAGAPLVAGALTGIAVTGLIGLGAELQKGNSQIQGGWASLKSQAEQTGQQASAGIVTPLATGMSQIQSLLAGTEPHFRTLFAGAAGDVPIMTAALGQVTQNALPGLENAVTHSQSITQGFGNILADTGTAASSIFDSIGSHAAQIAPALDQTGTLIAHVGTTVGALLPALSGGFGGVSTILTGMVSTIGAVAPALGSVSQYIPGVALGVKTFTSLKDPVSQAGTKVKEFANDMSYVGPGAETAKTAITGLGSAIGSSGVLGVAIGAAILAFTALGAAEQREAQLAKERSDAASAIAQALAQTNGALDDSVRATTVANLQGQDWVKTLTSQGVSLQDITDAALGNKDALGRVSTEVGNLGSQWTATGGKGSAVADNVLKSISFGLLSNSDSSNKAKDALGVLDGVWQQASQDASSYAQATQNATAASLKFDQQQLAAAQAGTAITTAFTQADKTVSQAADSLASANHSYEQSVGSVAAAQHGEAQAATAVADAQHGVVVAQRAVTDAVNSYRGAQQAVIQAQQSLIDAEHGVVSAEDSYTQSLYSERQAQQAVTVARQQAEQELVSLHLQLNDQIASEESARVKLFDQTATAAALGVTASNAQALAGEQVTASNEAQIKAALDLIDAQNSVADTLNTGKNLRNQVSAADKAGVDGNSAVVSAEQALLNAENQVVSAEQALVKSKQAVTAASYQVQQAIYNEQKAHQAIGDAQYGVAKAEQAVTDAKYAQRQASQAVTNALYSEQQAADAVKNAQYALQQAQDSASRSLDLTTAAGQRNLGMLYQLDSALVATGMPTQDRFNKLVQSTATFFQISTDKAAGYLKQQGLIPPNFRYNVTAVAQVDPGSFQGFLNAVISPGGNSASTSLSGLLGLGRARGGHIRGPGGPTGDRIPSLLSDNEYVQPASTVDHYGVGFMDALRAKQIRVVGGDGASLPGFAGGGLVTANIAGGLTGAAYENLVNADTVMGLPHPPGLPAYVPPAAPNLAGLLGGAVHSSSANVGIVQQVFEQMFGWGHGPEWAATIPLIMMESGFNNLAQNPTSTAFGIFQFLDSTWAGYGVGKTSDPRMQAVAGARYIKSRYGDPLGALAHERAFHWYDGGGYLAPGAVGGNTTGDREMVLPPGLTQTLEALHALVQAGGIGRGDAAPQVTQYITAAPSMSPEHIGALAAANTQWVLSTTRGG